MSRGQVIIQPLIAIVRVRATIVVSSSNPSFALLRSCGTAVGKSGRCAIASCAAQRISCVCFANRNLKILRFGKDQL